jgi:hypothetical protein
VVDRLSVRVLIDGAYNLFLRPGEVKGVKIELEVDETGESRKDRPSLQQLSCRVQRSRFFIGSCAIDARPWAAAVADFAERP